jgi:hypothetical protein
LCGDLYLQPCLLELHILLSTEGSLQWLGNLHRSCHVICREGSSAQEQAAARDTGRLTKEELDVRLATADCKIVDFGNACWTYKQFTSDIQTRQYRSPEVGPCPWESFSVCASDCHLCPVTIVSLHSCQWLSVSGPLRLPMTAGFV